MKNFSDYANIAINRHGLRGVNALARELQIKSSSMSRLNTGKSLPAESTMLKLAELAGLPKEEALIDLNLWRSAKNPEIQTVWLRLAKMIKYAFLAAFISPEKVNAAGLNFTSDNMDSDCFSIACVIFVVYFLLLHIKHYATISPVVFCSLLCALFALFALKLLTNRGVKWTNSTN